DELFSLVVDSEPFYVRELRRIKYHPGHIFEECDDGSYDNMFAGGKRYKVRMASAFDIEQLFTYGMGEIPFETVGLPYAESIGTTADIDKYGLRHSDELWSYGMGLSYDEETHKYSHSSRNFKVFNAGNVEVHPFEMDLIITIKGASKGYKLRNNTTGDVFEITNDVNGTFVLGGANITDNNLQALRKTNRRYISLSPKWNSFTQNQNAEVKFYFRFYYK